MAWQDHAGASRATVVSAIAGLAAAMVALLLTRGDERGGALVAERDEAPLWLIAAVLAFLLR
jgi:hypothetical protein